MPDPATAPALAATTVEELLRVAGVVPPDAATVERIAVGANNALAAVRAAGGHAGFDDAPDAFVAELARLAADDR
jgi:hypothetical protein